MLRHGHTSMGVYDVAGALVTPASRLVNLSIIRDLINEMQDATTRNRHAHEPVMHMLFLKPRR